MTTEQAIIRFKNGCALPDNIMRRHFAVKYQYQQNIWEVPEPLGLVRIINYGGNNCTITAYDKPNGKSIDKQPFTSDIPIEVYMELENLYKSF